MNPFQAPVGLMAGRRRPLRLGHVLVTLEDLLILYWRVAPSVLAPLLPAGMKPLVHEGCGLIGALIFWNRDLRLARLGIPRLDCVQMNLRSHILDPCTGSRGSVYFHGFRLASRWLAWLTARVLRLPCRVSPLRIRTRQAEHDARKGGRRAGGSRGDLESYEVASKNGSVMVTARRSASVRSPGQGLLDLLTNPHTGYVQVPGSDSVRRWSIWHPAKLVLPLDVDRAEIGPLRDLGLSLPPVAHAFYVPSIDYEVYLPARTVILPVHPPELPFHA